MEEHSTRKHSSSGKFCRGARQKFECMLLVRELGVLCFSQPTPIPPPPPPPQVDGERRDDPKKFKQLSGLLDGTNYFPETDQWHLDLWVELAE